MNVLTGARSTLEQLGDLMELAGLLDLPLLHHSESRLLDADALYRSAGWEFCPLAVADVTLAEAYGMTIKDL
ncbi:hypothetical protein OG912_32405 [Streptomyces sp. NBC_00464]|uniref:hypothetical protein n=1 Tax=Streptomyces sp. NBC_00464 TaxID=2975751 RepID=UPI002E190A42